MIMSSKTSDAKRTLLQNHNPALKKPGETLYCHISKEKKKISHKTTLDLLLNAALHVLAPLFHLMSLDKFKC